MKKEDRGIEILELKLEYLQELKGLTEQEKQILNQEAEDDILKLNSVHLEKDKVIERIDLLDEEYTELNFESYDFLEERKAKIQALLLDILELDVEKKRLMQAKFDGLKQNLKGVREGIKANKAYGYEEQGILFINEKK